MWPCGSGGAVDEGAGLGGVGLGVGELGAGVGDVGAGEGLAGEGFTGEGMAVTTIAGSSPVEGSGASALATTQPNSRPAMTTRLNNPVMRVSFNDISPLPAANSTPSA